MMKGCGLIQACCLLLSSLASRVAAASTGFTISSTDHNTTGLERRQQIEETFDIVVDGENIIQDGPYGKYGGTAWNDCDYTKYGNISYIEIRAGKYVDAIRVAYGGKFASMHGGNGGSFFGTQISDIYIVEGRYGADIDELTFRDGRGVVFGPYGGSGGGPFFAA